MGSATILSGIPSVRGRSESEAARVSDYIAGVEKEVFRFNALENPNKRLENILTNATTNTGWVKTPEDQKWLDHLKKALEVAKGIEELGKGDIEKGEERTQTKLEALIALYDMSGRHNEQFMDKLNEAMKESREDIHELTSKPRYRLAKVLDFFFVEPSEGIKQASDVFHEMGQDISKNGNASSTDWFVRQGTKAAHVLASAVTFGKSGMKSTDEQRVAFLQKLGELDMTGSHEEQQNLAYVTSLYNVLDAAVDSAARGGGAAAAYDLMRKLVIDQKNDSDAVKASKREELRKYGISNSVLLPGTVAAFKDMAKDKIANDISRHMSARMARLSVLADERLTAPNASGDKKGQGIISAEIWEIAKEKEALKKRNFFDQTQADELDRKYAEVAGHIELLANKAKIPVSQRTLTQADIDFVGEHMDKALSASEEDAVAQITINYMERTDEFLKIFGIPRSAAYIKLDEYFMWYYALRHVKRAPSPAPPAPTPVISLGGP